MPWAMSINAANCASWYNKVNESTYLCSTIIFPQHPVIPPVLDCFFRHILRVQSYQTSGVWMSRSVNQQRTTEIMEEKNFPRFGVVFVGKVAHFSTEQKSHLFIIKKSIETSQKSTPWKSESNMLYKKNWWLKPHDTIFCVNVFNIFPVFTKRCFYHPIWTKHASSSRASLPRPFFWDVKEKTQKHWENPTPIYTSK